MAIPKNAKNVELAQQFINFFLDPEVAAENMTYTLALVPNTGAYERLHPAIRHNPVLFPPEELINRSEVINDLGAAADLYHRAWDRVKASK
jgi:spermidine/putrescine transport system substrate-binding protein